MLTGRIRAWRDIFRRKGLSHGLAVLGNSLAARARKRLPALGPLLQTAPQTLDIEVSTICNLRCAGCLHGIEGGAFLREQQRFMPIARFRSIMEQVGARAHAVNLTTFGEVFLNPDIYEIIACAKSYGMLVQVDTNGHRLDPERVLASGLDEIAFAVDGITQENYETYRRGGRIDKVLENMRALHDLARERNHPIRIQAKFIVTAFTEGEIEAARALFASTMPGVHFFTSYFRVPAPDWHFYRRHPFATTPELHALWAPRAHREFDLYVPDPDSGLMRLNLLAMPFQNLCPAMHGGLYIHGNGDAYPCCHAAGMEHPDYLLGNVFEAGVTGVFHGERAREIRRVYDETGGRYSACASCIANRKAGVPLRDSATGELGSADSHLEQPTAPLPSPGGQRFLNAKTPLRTRDRAWTWGNHVWLVLCLLALGLGLALAASLAALRLGPLGGMEYHAVCAHTFGPREDADVVFTGDSALLNGVMPAVVEQGLGLRVVSLPLFAHSGGRSYQLALEQYLQRHPAPRCVVLYLTANAPSHWHLPKYERIFTLARYGSVTDLIRGGIGANDLFRTAWTFFLGWFQDDTHFRQVQENLRTGRGWQPPSLTKPLEDGTGIDSAAPIPPGALDIVDELARTLQARGIRFQFLLAPLPEGDAAVQEHARRYQGLAGGPLLTLPNRLFVDYTHMLPEAARENSRRVADILARELRP